jgi:hypothetical protein
MITERDILEATAYVDGVNIYNVGALVQSFTVSGTAISNSAYQGVNSTNFNVLSTTRGMRNISLTLGYKGETKRELALKKAKLDSMLGAGKIELYLPDGFYYTAYLTAVGEEAVEGVEGNKVIALCTYTLQGIRHDELKELTVTSGSTFLCESLIPTTDCRLSCKASQAYASLTIGSVTITSVAQNDTITIDGINKRILQNGAPCAGNMSFINFPQLVPGENVITCPETLTVEYYPTY